MHTLHSGYNALGVVHMERQGGNVRFAAKRKGRARWHLVKELSDADLVAKGFRLAGPQISLASLSREQERELLTLLGQPVSQLSREQLERESQLLALCPRIGLPPLDLDVRPDTPQKALVEAARRIDACAREIGVIPAWCWSGSGLHGDLATEVGHPDLFRAFLPVVKQIALEADVPLLSAHRSKESRPSVVLDDSLFQRSPRRRGNIWRLIGASSKKGKKRPADLLGDGLASYHVVPVAAELVHSTLAKWEAQSGQYGSRQPQQASKPPPPIEQATLLSTQGPIRENPHLHHTAAFLRSIDDQRNATAMAVAGVLLRRRVDHAEVEGLLGGFLSRSRGGAIGSGEARRIVRNAVSRLEADQPVGGLGMLERSAGQARANRLNRAVTADLGPASCLPYSLCASFPAEEVREGLAALKRNRMSRCFPKRQCGSPYCSWCGVFRAKAILDRVRLGPRLGIHIAVLPLRDTRPSTALAAKARWTKASCHSSRSSLSVASPGCLVVLAEHPEATLRDRYGLRPTSRREAIEILREALVEIPSQPLAYPAWVGRKRSKAVAGRGSWASDRSGPNPPRGADNEVRKSQSRFLSLRPNSFLRSRAPTALTSTGCSSAAPGRGRNPPETPTQRMTVTCTAEPETVP